MNTPGVHLALVLTSALAACTSTSQSTPQSTPPHTTPPHTTPPHATPLSSEAADQVVDEEAPTEAPALVSTPTSALTNLSAWLDAQDDLRAFSRTELITGTWLVWLRYADHSTLCIEVRDEAPRCWREAGAVTRVVPYAWTHRSEPEGFLAVFRGRAQGVFWSFRTHPELQRGYAESRFFLAQTRPSWWPTEHSSTPNGVIDRPRHGALTLDEAPDLGPLRWLSVTNLHMRGQDRVAEREDSVIVATAAGRRVLCVRQASWTCSAPFGDEEGAENEYLDGFDVDGTSIALIRSVRREDAGAGSATAHLEFWERRELRERRVSLEHRGSVQLGRATWRPDEGTRRQVERVLHSVHVEADLCLRIDDAETEQGSTDVDFNALGEARPLNLARAPSSVEFAASQERHLEDLGGLWRLDASGLTRADCAPEPRTLLAQVAIPPDLEPSAAACLASLNEQIDELPSMSIVEGNACGATYSDNGIITARERFRYEGEKRVESVRVERESPYPDSRFVYHEHFFWRGTRRVGGDYESVHFQGGEEECRHTHTRRETSDTQGRPTRVRLQVRPCEGDERNASERHRWRRGDGFDTRGDNSERHYFVPTYAESTAEVSCGRGGCSCDVDARDESGRMRLRLNSNTSARSEYLYDCPPMTWPQTTEDLRQLSIETSFEATPAGG